MGTLARLLPVLALLLLAAPLRADGLLPKEGDKIVFLGDTLTADGWDLPGGYVRLVVAGLQAEGIHVTPIPAGVPGNPAKEQVRRLDPGLLDQQPNWVVLFPGQADVRAGVVPDDFHRSVFSLLDESQAKKANILVVTAPPFSEEAAGTEADRQLAAHNEFLRGLARERKYSLADAGALFAKALQADPPAPGTRLLTVPGGGHLNPAGNRLVALAILQAWGVPSADFAKIEAAWDAIPAAASLGTGFQPVAVPLTFAQYDALARAAQARHLNADGLAAVLYGEAVREVLQARPKDAANLSLLQYEIQKRFADKVTAAASGIKPPAK